MKFEQWLTANGYDAEKLSASQRKHLMAAWQSETAPVAEPVAETVATLPATEAKGKTRYELDLELARKESDRCSQIDALAGEQIRANVHYPERIERFDLLRKAAIEGSWDLQKFQLEMMKEKHNVGPIVSIVSSQEASNEVVEAAVCRAAGLTNIEHHFSDRVLSAVDKRWKHGLGLKEMLVVAAERNNSYRGSHRDLHELCNAAFRDRNGDPRFRSDNGPSTIAVTGILSNIANKFLESGFTYCEQSWRPISRIRPANDYKEMTIYRMGGSAKFEKVAPGGEIKHGTLSELSYGLKADIYGKMLGISEQDIRNDDLSAFTGAADEIGRGAGDSMNEIFWAEALDDSAFFPTDKSLANYDDGSTDSVLSLAGLDNAEIIFRRQTKPDGTLLGAMPAILLVPASLTNTALHLMGSQGLVVGTTPASGPDRNVYAGRYRTVSSAFLDASSTTAWYLLADPNAIAIMQICFLDGVDTPRVETAMFDFDRLGMAMRGTMRWGCRKAEYRGGVKLKGAA